MYTSDFGSKSGSLQRHCCRPLIPLAARKTKVAKAVPYTSFLVLKIPPATFFILFYRGEAK